MSTAAKILKESLREKDEEIEQLKREVNELEKLVEDSAELIESLRGRKVQLTEKITKLGNEQQETKAENKELHKENESLVEENNQLTNRMQILEIELNSMKKEAKMNRLANTLLSGSNDSFERTEKELLENHTDSDGNNDVPYVSTTLQIDKESKLVYEKYEELIRKYIHEEEQNANDFFEDLFMKLKNTAEDCCDALVAADAENTVFQEKYGSLLQQKKDEESGRKKALKRRNDTKNVFEFGSPSARFMDEDSEVLEEEEEEIDEETDDNNFKTR